MASLSILLVAADSGEGELGDMLDPTLRDRLAAEGLHARATYLSDLKREHLDSAHVVVLLRAPIPGHPRADAALFKEKGGWLRAHAEAGGGLLVMFTECYAKAMGSLNELCAPWGARFFFNRLVPGPEVLVERMPRFYEGVILPFRFVDNPFITPPSSDLGLITEGGHGTQHLTCAFEPDSPIAWQPILRGGARITSVPYRGAYSHSSDGEISDPVACAAAEVGQGRVLLFPGSAPFWIVNSHIWRFQGYLHDQRHGAGFRFFVSAFRWLADTARNRALGPAAVERLAAAADESLLVKTRYFSFAAVDEPLQSRLRRSLSQDVWFGAAPHGRADLKALGARLMEAGYTAAFPLADYRKLDEGLWKEALAIGREVSSERMLVMPGYELLDDEGVRTAVLSPETFPRHDLSYPNSTLLEAVWVPLSGCASIVRDVLRNRIPLQRYGGYNLIEWDPLPAWSALYRQLVASKYCVSPVYFSRSPEDTIARTSVLVPLGAKPFDMLRGNRHATYVTSGPRIESFGLFGPGLIDDEWEGHWYGYLPGEELELTVSLSAKVELDQVVIWDGTEKFASFSPGERRFTRRIRFQAWRDHCFHLTASDAEGGILHASFPVYTRNLRFWGHVGSDQMNNYVNPMAPSERGFLGVGRTFYDPFGFVTMGTAWGDYLRITPAIRFSDYMPRQEISHIIGSFSTHHPSAVLTAGKQTFCLNDHRRVFPFCGADAHAFHGDIAGQHLDNARRIAQTWHNRMVVPTRVFLPVPGAKCSDDYVVWRWSHGEQVYVEVWKYFVLDPRYLADEWITFATNTHYPLPWLFVRSIRNPAYHVTVAELPVWEGAPPPLKEWDNTRCAGIPAAYLTCFEPEEGGEIEIGDGHAGTFGFLPLGRPRGYRCLLAREGKLVKVFFQCRPTDEERAAATFTVHYLLALDPADTEESPFAGDLLAMVDRLSAAGERRFSVELNAGERGLPAEVDLDERFPALSRHRIWLRVTGLPDRIVEWTEHGRVVFASQAKRGRSYHIIEPGMPRKYKLRAKE
ncbi:MAG: hypothetical protein JXB04_09575 [Kiritimatiellae bacterium]|nr:hypothetical protein [Kiritimatiellia bacterium]